MTSRGCIVYHLLWGRWCCIPRDHAAEDPPPLSWVTITIMIWSKCTVEGMQSTIDDEIYLPCSSVVYLCWRRWREDGIHITSRITRSTAIRATWSCCGDAFHLHDVWRRIFESTIGRKTIWVSMYMVTFLLEHSCGEANLNEDNSINVNLKAQELTFI